VAKKLDQIIVVDVESTCWQGSKPALYAEVEETVLS
jgi:hypothetical protein